MAPLLAPVLLCGAADWGVPDGSSVVVTVELSTVLFVPSSLLTSQLKRTEVSTNDDTYHKAE